MDNRLPSLSEHLAGLRNTAQARQETCARILDPIHALIIAALARIFARLEQLLALWQAGSLPVPPARSTTRQDRPHNNTWCAAHAAARHAPSRHAPSSQTARPWRDDSRATPAAASTPAAAPSWPAIACPLPRHSNPAPPRDQSRARAPPASAEKPAFAGRDRASISFRLRNILPPGT